MDNEVPVDELIALAVECGAEPCFGNDVPECQPAWTLDASALINLAERIREDALEEAAQIAAQTYEGGTPNTDEGEGYDFMGENSAEKIREAASKYRYALHPPG